MVVGAPGVAAPDADWESAARCAGFLVVWLLI